MNYNRFRPWARPFIKFAPKTFVVIFGVVILPIYAVEGVYSGFMEGIRDIRILWKEITASE